MKLRCERDDLSDALTAVSRAASYRSSIRILSGVRLEAVADRLVIAATDTELAIRATAPALVSEDGVGVLPARTLLELVKRMPGGEISLEAEGDPLIHLRSAEGEFRLNALSASDFPDIPTVAATDTARLDRAALANAFSFVGRVAARDLSRPVYTGILVAVERGTLSMVATDSYRLAVARVEATTSRDIAPTLVPARAIAELLRLPHDNGHVDVTVGENVITFELGDYRIVARRLNGQFQPWEQLLTGEFAYEAVVDRERLLAGVERANVLVQRGTPVSLAFRNDTLEITVDSAEVGHASEQIAIKPSEASITLAFNPAYLIDGLQMIESDAVRIRMNDSLRPAVLSSTTSDLTYLIGPVRAR